MNQGNSNAQDPWFSGDRLYGDDFSREEILRWYEEEEEGYANLGNTDPGNYSYDYHALNRFHGFRFLPKGKRFKHVMGFGSAWGHEFQPLTGRIDALSIVDPSENMCSEQIGNLVPSYVKPTPEGKLQFEDHSFDLITSFGVLHHIPNVSFVLEEILRVLKPGGLLLLREPIISFGDWNKARPGLTRNERGIPLKHFQHIFRSHNVTILHQGHCFTMTYQLQKLLGKFLKKPVYSYMAYIRFDAVLSALLQKNVRYHATRKINRIAPTSVFFAIRKDQ